MADDPRSLQKVLDLLHDCCEYRSSSQVLKAAMWRNVSRVGKNDKQHGMTGRSISSKAEGLNNSRTVHIMRQQVSE